MPRDVSLSDSKCWNGGHEWVKTVLPTFSKHFQERNVCRGGFVAGHLTLRNVRELPVVDPVIHSYSIGQRHHLIVYQFIIIINRKINSHFR